MRRALALCLAALCLAPALAAAEPVIRLLDLETLVAEYGRGAELIETLDANAADLARIAREDPAALDTLLEGVSPVHVEGVVLGTVVHQTLETFAPGASRPPEAELRSAVLRASEQQQATGRQRMLLDALETLSAHLLVRWLQGQDKLRPCAISPENGDRIDVLPDGALGEPR